MLKITTKSKIHNKLYWKNVITIQTWFDLTRFGKRFLFVLSGKFQIRYPNLLTFLFAQKINRLFNYCRTAEKNRDQFFLYYRLLASRGPS